MILISDPRVAAVPVHDTGEAMVDLRTVDELRVDDRLADPAGAYAHMREGAVSRLLAAQRSLPAGLRLLVVEAYRPLSLQRSYFNDYQSELRALYPGWDEERVYVEASKYVSPPSVAPHSTGGTVDLTLVGPDGRELDMGTAVNDSPVASGNACFTAAAHISALARRNRYVLGTALRLAGFANYPTEWWHWSYGDRYWALGTGASQTRYGPIDLS
ncbi:D-alanyl-D-alanine dipeptidase [Asanoa ishikariensis]|uniref:D-alanyl-D-alanine dipeptidase n=1 Tax=Asanoa ishikariensis TaxID=137265 RepID=A0A1H3UMY0_9ACTN|nr:M15 family metallopeptidase [Asanoa ishikariensis]GIF69026.1 D-alanyl-D-alanine dipeptidase [Asanoa ishikariensis]SDZ63792.1 D-alanyl-D-alanine dipeptidase [Asanoa ishikariensis]